MIKIRPINTTDYLKVVRVIRKTLRVSFKKLYCDKLIKSFCKKYTIKTIKERVKNTKYFLAEDTKNNKVIGIIGLRKNQIRTFFVDPDYQGKGVGRMLYNDLELLAKKNKLTFLLVESSPIGLTIYQKFGFKKIKDLHKFRSGISYADVLMKKVLS